MQAIKGEQEEYGVSILISCFNSGTYISDTIESIFAQDIIVPFEVIIIDDGSTDQQTKDILQGIHVDPVSVIWCKENKGPTRARSVGVNRAQYKYIFHLDSDDRLNNDPTLLAQGSFLDRAVTILEEDESVAFVYPQTYMIGDKKGYTRSAYPINESMVLRKHHVSTWIVHRKEDAQAAQPYDTSIVKWTDWSFAVGILNARFLAGKQNTIRFIQKPYYLYRIHQTKSRVSSSQQKEADMILKTVNRYPEIFQKYYPGKTHEEIASLVCSLKPDWLIDWLYIVRENFFIAMGMLRRKGFALRLAQCIIARL